MLCVHCHNTATTNAFSDPMAPATTSTLSSPPVLCPLRRGPGTRGRLSLSLPRPSHVPLPLSPHPLLPLLLLLVPVLLCPHHRGPRHWPSPLSPPPAGHTGSAGARLLRERSAHPQDKTTWGGLAARGHDGSRVVVLVVVPPVTRLHGRPLAGVRQGRGRRGRGRGRGRGGGLQGLFGGVDRVWDGGPWEIVLRDRGAVPPHWQVRCSGQNHAPTQGVNMADKSHESKGSFVMKEADTRHNTQGEDTRTTLCRSGLVVGNRAPKTFTCVRVSMCTTVRVHGRVCDMW